MLHRLSLLLLLLCSAIVAPDLLWVYDMMAWDIWRAPFVSGNWLVIVYCDNRRIGTTEVKNNTRDPEWKEDIWYLHASPGNRLMLGVYDKDVTKYNNMGTCIETIRTGYYKHACYLFKGGQLNFSYILE